MSVFEQYLLVMAARKNNPLLKVDLEASHAEWSMGGRSFEQMTEIAIDPRDGKECLMRGVALSIREVHFSKSEQFVTYADGNVQKERVYWDTGLQIYYWQSPKDNAWYFEDPYHDDVVTKAGSYHKLFKKLEYRQFWWLETNEDVSVIRNPDGSKSYAYRVLQDPVQITARLEEEAQQEQITSERPVSKWKAVALSAITLLGHATGFQSLAKSYISGAEPKQPKPSTADTTIDTLKLSPANLTVGYKPLVQAGNANYFGQHSSVALEHLSQTMVSTLPFFSAVTTGIASIIHPRPAREQGMFGFSKLFTLLATAKSTGGSMIAETNKKSFAPKPTTDLPDTEVFTHAFAIPTLSDVPLLTPQPITYLNSNPEMEALIPEAKTAAHHFPPMPLDIPLAHFSGQTESMQTPNQKMMSLSAEQPAQQSLVAQPLWVDTQIGQTPPALPPMTPTEANALSNTLKMINDTLKELKRCTREVEEKMIVKDEKSAQEKATTLRLLNKLDFALSGTSESLRKAESLSHKTADEEMSRQIKMLEEALVDVRAYFTKQAPDSSLASTSDTNFLSNVSAAVSDVDLKTLAIVLGVVGSVIVGIGAYMLWRRFRENNYVMVTEERSRVMPTTSEKPKLKPIIDVTGFVPVTFKSQLAAKDDDGTTFVVKEDGSKIRFSEKLRSSRTKQAGRVKPKEESGVDLSVAERTWVKEEDRRITEEVLANPFVRMYVPQRYLGLFLKRKLQEGEQEISQVKYLATSGAGPCVVLAVFAESESHTLAVISHLDSDHNSKQKLVTYFQDLEQLIRSKLKEIVRMRASVIVSKSDHITPCINHPVNPQKTQWQVELRQKSDGTYEAHYEYCALQTKIQEALVESRLVKSEEIVVLRSQTREIDAVVSIADGECYQYDENQNSNQFPLRETEATVLKFNERFQIAEGGELYYLKDRGGLCRIDGDFNSHLLRGYCFYSPVLTSIYDDYGSQICLGQDQMPTTTEEQNERKVSSNPNIFKFKFA